ARQRIVGAAEGHEVRHLDVLELVGSRHHGADQLLGVVAPGVDPDVGSRAYPLDGFGRAGDAAPVAFGPLHGQAPGSGRGGSGAQGGATEIARASLARRPRWTYVPRRSSATSASARSRPASTTACR